MALALVHQDTGEPAGSPSFAARFTRRILERVPSGELRAVFARVATELDERARQRPLFGEPELIPIPPAGTTEAPAEASLATMLSPSQVRTFMDCPTRWWYRYGLHLADPVNAARALGIAVHDALAENFRQKAETREDLPLEAIAPVYEQAFAAAFDSAVLREKDNAAELKVQGAQMIALYLTEAAPTIQPAAVEVPIETECGGVRVQGRLDLIDADGAITDYKTAARKPSGIDQMYRFQVATYAGAAPGASGFVRLDTLTKTKSPQLVRQEWTIEDRDRQACETLYPLAQAGMRSGIYMPNRCSMMCSRDQCAYWRRCEDEFGGEVPQS